jgi:hypothetical protein
VCVHKCRPKYHYPSEIKIDVVTVLVCCIFILLSADLIITILLSKLIINVYEELSKWALLLIGSSLFEVINYHNIQCSMI